MDDVKHTKYHWACCWQPLLGILLWVLATASLIFAWVAKDAVFLGYSGLGWYWNALVLGVLAIPLKARGHHGCWGGHGDCANCEAGKCDMHKGKTWSQM